MLLILLLIAITMTSRAWPAFSELGASYFFGTEWIPSEGKYGIVPLVYGTIVVSLIGLVFSVPVSIGIALFVTEVAPGRLRRPVVTVIDVLAAVPVGRVRPVGLLQPAADVPDGLQRHRRRRVAPIPVLNTTLRAQHRLVVHERRADRRP